MQRHLCACEKIERGVSKLACFCRVFATSCTAKASFGTLENGKIEAKHVLRLAGLLRKKDFDAFFETMTAIFAAIPYDIEAKRDEAYFHTLFYLMMAASGIDARSSVLTCRGRIDVALVGHDAIYIIEFKCGQSADAAIRQIKANRYADPYRADGKPIYLIGIEFSPEQRNLAGWKIERSDELSQK